MSVKPYIVNDDLAPKIISFNSLMERHQTKQLKDVYSFKFFDPWTETFKYINQYRSAQPKHIFGSPELMARNRAVWSDGTLQCEFEDAWIIKSSLTLTMVEDHRPFDEFVESLPDNTVAVCELSESSYEPVLKLNHKRKVASDLRIARKKAAEAK